MSVREEPVVTAAQPQPRLLTIDEYAALGETDNGYTELIEPRRRDRPRRSHG